MKLLEQATFFVSVFVHSGGCNKIPQSGWLMNNRDCGAWKCKIRLPIWLDEDPLLVPDFSCVLKCQKRSESHLRPFVRALMSFMRALPLSPNISHRLKSITLGIKITQYEFWENRHIQTIAFGKIVMDAEFTLYLSVFCLSRGLTTLEKKVQCLKRPYFI